MRRFVKSFLLAAVMLLALCGTGLAEAGMVLADTQQITENRTYRGGYAAGPFEGKIVMSDIKGSKVSSKPWVGFYGRMADGSRIKFDLEFADGNIQVCALYKGDKKGLLDRKYLLREVLPAQDKWHYYKNFTIEVYDGNAVISLGNKTYIWPGVTGLTGEIEVGRVSGKLEIYNYLQEE